MIHRYLKKYTNQTVIHKLLKENVKKKCMCAWLVRVLCKSHAHLSILKVRGALLIDEIRDLKMPMFNGFYKNRSFISYDPEKSYNANLKHCAISSIIV